MRKRILGRSRPSGRGDQSADRSFHFDWRMLGPLLVAVICLTAVFTSALPKKQKRVTTKTISGFVLDQNDNGIVDAAVSIADLQSGKKFTAASQEGGQFSFANLPPGHDYEVQAVYKDKSSEVRKVSSLDTRLRIVLNLRIPPAKE